MMSIEEEAKQTQGESVAKRKKPARKRKAKKEKTKTEKTESSRKRHFPATALREALGVPLTIKVENGGKPFESALIADRLGYSSVQNNKFFYLTTASRDFGLTEGTRNNEKISLTDFGRELVYAHSPEQEASLKKQAFLNIRIFAKILEHYNGSQLPEMKYLSNTLEKEYGLPVKDHKLFSELFKENCKYLGIEEGVREGGEGANVYQQDNNQLTDGHQNIVTLAEPDKDTGLKCFVILPFSERDESRAKGFFEEVLAKLIVPAGRDAGFKVFTAKRSGSDIIQSTIIDNLLNADLVIADLTEHNPNVLFELGVRMAIDKPVALIREDGTAQIFDVDSMLRVLDYNGNLWSSTVERDLPKMIDHINSAWRNRGNEKTYMKILLRK